MINHVISEAKAKEVVKEVLESLVEAGYAKTYDEAVEVKGRTYLSGCLVDTAKYYEDMRKAFDKFEALYKSRTKWKGLGFNGRVDRAFVGFFETLKEDVLGMARIHLTIRQRLESPFYEKNPNKLYTEEDVVRCSVLCQLAITLRSNFYNYLGALEQNIENLSWANARN